MIILKDAYVLTLNQNNESGRMSILIGEGRIIDIARFKENLPFERDKPKVEEWIEKFGEEAEVIDCSGKLLMPAMVNSCLRSDGVLFKYLLRNRHYENTEGDFCTDFIFNYLYREEQTQEIRDDLINIYNFSFISSLKSGTGLLNEFSLRKDLKHLEPVSDAAKLTRQKIISSYPIKQDVKASKEFRSIIHSNYLTDEGQLTIYDISFLGELKHTGIKKLFLEVATNKEVCSKFQHSFNKSVIKLLDEHNLIDSDTSLINPLYLNYEDLRIISERQASVIICPSDLIHFSNRYLPLDDFIDNGISYSVATGWLGNDLLSEVHLLRNQYKELNIPSSEILRSITSVPGKLYFYDDPEYFTPCSISHNKYADILFINLNDSRFQLFAESLSFEKLCEFLLDNLTAMNVTDVMLKGEFLVRDNRLRTTNEDEIISRAEDTRKRLYAIGRYDDQKARKLHPAAIKSSKSSTYDENMIQFSEINKETSAEDTSETFRIKSRIPSFKRKVTQDQKNLFEDSEKANIIQPSVPQDSPELNLLYTEVEQSRIENEEILLNKIADAKFLSQKFEEKKEKKAESEGKVELPKNVKLKFGD